MGNDGGSIPTRRELVKEAARSLTISELKETRQEKQEYHWTTDPISNTPLVQPVVSDCSGKLYNKDTILEYLVEGSRKEDAERITRGAIKSLKDVVEVKFEVGSSGEQTSARENWVCTITGDKLGPGSKAVYLVPCGHAFSGAAIKEVSGEKCLACETEYAANDVIPIVPSVDMDIARLALRAKVLKEQGLSHSLKKASSGGKKRKKKDESVPTADGVKDAAADPSLKAETARLGVPEDASTTNGSKSINNASTASLTAKVLDEQDRAKKRKLENDNVRSLFSSRDQSKPSGKSGDFMTRGYSVPVSNKR
ncbi:hypothetical protein LTR62_000659 [Meristemomyces frigidus]|uniref:Replication termination factor 2 n=1 Tax=Meristemomyces frigidus TaxID=1508187 RepID=A0AAN7T9X6_9PEZI|nr:hypothetical protein LTR62_000659 [Meristemomyces frigidus]